MLLFTLVLADMLNTATLTSPVWKHSQQSLAPFLVLSTCSKTKRMFMWLAMRKAWGSIPRAAPCPQSASVPVSLGTYTEDRVSSVQRHYDILRLRGNNGGMVYAFPCSLQQQSRQGWLCGLCLMVLERSAISLRSMYGGKLAGVWRH